VPKTSGKTALFHISKFLGKGGIGKVFLASRGEQKLALKFLQSTLDSKLLSFFREEVRLLSQLSHPNLVKIDDFYDLGSGAKLLDVDPTLSEKVPIQSPFFSMEYIEGQRLDTLIAQVAVVRGGYFLPHPVDLFAD